MNIILSGMMGCGKTTVAKALSELYGFNLIDTDALIVACHGEISQIFNRFGEHYFREIEAATVKDVAENAINSVISLGGGCVLRQENVNNLRRCGKIFYLRTGAETIIERLKGDRTRPLLAGNLEERVNSVLSARAALYEAAADFIVDTDGIAPERLAVKIKEMTE